MVFKKRASEVFKRFLVSYCILFVIFLILFLYAYYENSKLVQQNIKKVGVATLKNCMTALDSRFEEMENYANYLCYNQQIQAFSQRKSPYEDGTTVYSINEIRQAIAPAKYNNQFIKEVAIYFINSNVVVSCRGAHLGLEYYYEDFFSYSDYEIDEFKDILVNNNFFNKFFPNDKLSVKSYGAHEVADRGFVFVRSLPLYGKPSGQIIFSVSESEIKNLLSSVTEEWGADVFIYDQNKEIFFSTQEVSASVDEKAFLVSTTSSFNNWTYEMRIPQKVIGDKMYKVRWMLVVYLLIGTTIGIGVAVYLSFRNSKPIVNIIQGLFQSNDDLSRTLQRQLPLMRTTFVENLIGGYFETEEDVFWFQKQLNFRPLNGKIIVLIIRIDVPVKRKEDIPIGDINIVKSLCEKVISLKFNTDVYYYDSSFDRRVVVFALTPTLKEEMKKEIECITEELYNKMLEEFGFTIHFSGGDFVDSYFEIESSYIRACQGMDSVASKQKASIVWPEDTESGEKSYYYPLKVEMKIINCIKSGNIEEVTELLKHIYQVNFVDQRLSSEMMGCLIFEIKGTMVKLVDDLLERRKGELSELKNTIFNIENCHHVIDVFENIDKIFNMLCMAYSEDNNRKNSDIIKRVKKYVDDQYYNPQIDLNEVANYFNITPSYLSQLFKSNVGMNFSVYLEELRIETACNYLSEEIPIGEVATKVGYNSVYVFRNAFKRKKGVSPSQYRTMMLNDSKFKKD